MSKEIAELKEVNSDLKQSLDWANERESEDVNRIAELEAENANLKERNGELAGQKASLERWFGEAKEIIKGLLESCFGYNSKTVNYEIKAKAEQFLKENDE